MVAGWLAGWQGGPLHGVSARSERGGGELWVLDGGEEDVQGHTEDEAEAIRRRLRLRLRLRVRRRLRLREAEAEAEAQAEAEAETEAKEGVLR